jgi:hypothetical protein
MLGGCCGTGLAIVVAIILAVVTYRRRAEWDTRHGSAASLPQGVMRDDPLPPPGDWQAPPGPPPGPAGEPPDPYRPQLEDPPPPDEDRLY